MAGFLSSAACAVIGLKTGDPIWLGLARTGAWLNILNLIPIWVLDGAGAMMPLSWIEKFLVTAVSAGIGYATHEGVFYFVAAGAVFNMVVTSMARRQVARAGTIQLNLNSAGEAVQSGPSYAGGQAPRSGSPLIAAYFIAVLALLGAVLYLLPGHGSGLPY